MLSVPCGGFSFINCVSYIVSAGCAIKEMHALCGAIKLTSTVNEGLMYEVDEDGNNVFHLIAASNLNTIAANMLIQYIVKSMSHGAEKISDTLATLLYLKNHHHLTPLDLAVIHHGPKMHKLMKQLIEEYLEGLQNNVPIEKAQSSNFDSPSKSLKRLLFDIYGSVSAISMQKLTIGVKRIFATNIHKGADTTNFLNAVTSRGDGTNKDMHHLPPAPFDNVDESCIYVRNKVEYLLYTSLSTSYC